MAGVDELDGQFRKSDFYGKSKLPKVEGYSTCTEYSSTACYFSPKLKIQSEERNRDNRTLVKFRNADKTIKINQAEKKVLRDLRHDLGHFNNYLKDSKVNKKCKGKSDCIDPEGKPIEDCEITVKGDYRGRRHAPFHDDYNHELKECYPLPILEDAFFLSAIHKDLDYLKKFYDNDLLKKNTEIAQWLVDYILQNDKMFDDPETDFRAANHQEIADEAGEKADTALNVIKTHQTDGDDSGDDDSQDGGINLPKKRHDPTVTQEKKKELAKTSRDTIEKLKDAVSCRMDFLWAHFLGLNFTGNECTFCHDEGIAETLVKCPIRDNENSEQKYKARLLDIDAALLCEQPGRCSDMRNLFNL